MQVCGVRLSTSCGQRLEGWRLTTDWGRQYPAGVADTAHNQPPLVGWRGAVHGPCVACTLCGLGPACLAGRSTHDWLPERSDLHVATAAAAPRCVSL